MEEGYISKDSIFTASTNTHFSIKGKCKASMKREIRSMQVTLSKKTGKVITATCDCPAGKSQYYNHIMGLLFEIAEFSLHQQKEVPEEMAFTSTSRQWGVPSDIYKYPRSVMNFSMHKRSETRGVSCTLYNPKINEDKNFVERVAKTHINVVKKDKRIGYGHVMNFSMSKVSTKYGDFMTGSPLSYQLSTFENNFKIISNIEPSQNLYKPDDDHIDFHLPYNVITADSEYCPNDWRLLNDCKMLVLNKISLETLEDSQSLEKKTIGQASNEN